MCDEYGNYVGEGYSDDSASMSYASTVATNNKSRRQDIADAKKLDPGYNKIYRVIKTNTDGQITSKRVAIEVYTTTLTPGKMIRSALGGAYHANFRVGKYDEHIFYKVGLSTGECKGDSSTLFFDTPEQYEKTFYVTIPQEDKEAWYTRFNAERKYRETAALQNEAKMKTMVR